MITKTIRLTVWILVLLCAGTAASHASPPGFCKDDKDCHRTRPVCFNLFCSFQRQEEGKFERCEVASTFTQLVTEEGWEVRENSEEPFNPTFEVKCDHEVVFNGKGHRYTDHLGTRIQAIPGPFPAIVMPRNALREERHYSEASLEFDRERLDGFCYVYTGPQ